MNEFIKSLNMFKLCFHLKKISAVCLKYSILKGLNMQSLCLHLLIFVKTLQFLNIKHKKFSLCKFCLFDKFINVFCFVFKFCI